MAGSEFRTEDPERLGRLRAKNALFTIEMFDPEGKGIPKMHPYEEHFEKRPDGSGHPRVLFTREQLPDIRKSLWSDEASEARKVFFEMIEEETDGLLPPAEEKERGFYTLDNRLLLKIQAKALAYQLSGNREYGYEAVIAMKNYLRTMEIRWLKNDICRHFGYAMYMAACVYDWCYDLLTEEDRRELICGTGYGMCIGETDGIMKAGFSYTIDKVKMEIGFPPVHQNAVTGHGCELQLLRDYLSFAIAIFDEEPSWWYFVGARLYREYPPVRKIYYEAGIYPQGPGYASFRFIADLWAFWLIRTALSEDIFPAENMKKVLPSLLSFETVDGKLFHVGDRINYRGKGDGFGSSFAYCCNIAAAMFHDPGMKAWAKYFRLGYLDFEAHDIYGGAPDAVGPSEFILLNADGTVPAEDRYSGMSLLNYNGGFYQNLNVRNGHGGDSAVVMMKGAGRSTANHDHHDSATFQIYYKGLQTGDSGRYDTYSSAQHFYYHQSTIAHNGILVYNPAMGDLDLQIGPAGIPVNRMRYYYSGGQRVVQESGGLTRWRDPVYNMGYPLGVQAGFEKEDGEKPHYAYFGTDYTESYHPETVEKIRRYMLTVYTGQKEVPMLFFVHDEIRAKSGAFRKAFLLQCPAEPQADEARGKITLEDEDGKLVLQTLRGCGHIEVYGGPEKQFYNPKDGDPAHGINIPCQVEGASSEVWGHAEIVAPPGSCETVYDTVTYVTDRGAEPELTAGLSEEEALDGAFLSLKGRKYLFGRLLRKEADFAAAEEDREMYLFSMDPGPVRIFLRGQEEIRQVTEAGRLLELRIPKGEECRIRPF